MEHLFHLNGDRLSWGLDASRPYSFADRVAQLAAPHQKLYEDPVKRIIQAVLAASCTIIVNAPDGQWTGSGFHIGNGIVATAGHVAPPELIGQTGVLQLSFDSQTVYPAEVIGSEPNYDCALIYCPKILETIPPVLLGDSDKAQVGDIIAVIGSPLGFPDTASVGRISNIHQSLGNEAPTPAWRDFLMVDAQIHQGVSGGMVILTSGEVVGSVIGITGDHADIGVGEQAVCPSNKIRALLSRIIHS
jgi:S1-C subfamily serine protease